MGKIIGHSDSDLSEAATALAAGRLVAIPTETVYGLGGNALLPSAVTKIYTAKGRPFTDPLICHFDSLEKAVRVWDTESNELALGVATTIGSALWPGPLTIVFKAHPSLPDCVTGGSGFVGARIPNHPVALALLRLVDFPVAAPSANTFGHVSPTTARHVYDDLSERDPELLIVDGGSSGIGIESTVIKVNSVDHVEVLRRGKISVSDIQKAIAQKYPNTMVEIRDTRSKFLGGVDKPMDGPGQLLTHYSPRVPASLITPSGVPDEVPREKTVVLRAEESFPMSQTVIIDFNGVLRRFQSVCLAYRDLSTSGSAPEACFEVFDALRWSELVEGARNVIFPFLSEWPQQADADLLAAVEDRLFRAASGTVALVRSQ